MLRRAFRPLSALIETALVLTVMSASVHAQVDFNWNDPNGGDFNDPNNWSSFFPGAIPDVFVRTIFDLPASYTVDFTRDERTSGTSVRSGNVRFNLAGNAYRHGDLFVGELADDIAELTLASGLVEAGPTAIGDAESTFGALIVGNSATLQSGFLRVGSRGVGQLLIRDGGRVSAAAALAATELSGVGTIEVDGAAGTTRSTLTSAGAISIGVHNQGALRVTGGALVESHPTGFDDPDEIGLFPAPGVGGGLGAVGQVLVDGTTGAGQPSAWISTGPLLMGNVAGNSYAQGMMTITGGGQVQHTEALLLSAAEAPNRVEIRGIDAAGNSSKWTLTDGQLNLVGELEVTDGGQLDAQRGVVLGWADGLAGHLTVSGANANGVQSSYTGGGISVGSSGDGVLHVTEGGHLSAPGIAGSMNLATKSTGRGDVLIAGRDAHGIPSTVEVGRTINVGHEGPASLTIADGGVLRSGFDDPNSFGMVALRPTTSPVDILVTDPDSSWEHANDLLIGGTAGGPGGQATMTIDDRATVNIGGKLKVWDASNLQLLGGTISAGTVELASGSDLQFGIGGPQPVDDFGQLLVGDDAFLDGNLRVALLDEFEPATEDTFIVLDAFDLVSDTFENVLPGGRLPTTNGMGSFRVDYGASSPFGANQIVLSEFLAVANPGDYNNDGVVNAADYAVWREHLGTPITLPNDLSPGTVDQSDYVTWKSNFGTSVLASAASHLPTAQGVPLPTAVPEPSTCAVLALALALFLSLPRQRLLPLFAIVATFTAANGSIAETLVWDGSDDQFWNNPINWTPAIVPVNGDDAVILTSPHSTIRLNSDAIDSPVDSVTFGGGSNVALNTNGFRLKIEGNGSSSDDGRLRIEDGARVFVADVIADDALPGLEAKTVRVGFGGTFSSTGYSVVGRLVDVLPGGTVASIGTIELGALASGAAGERALVNDGTISVGTLGAGTLQLRVNGDAFIDLDGVTDTGVVRANADNFTGSVGSAELHVVGRLADPFSGEMQIGPSDTIRFDEPWELDGSLQFRGSLNPHRAVLLGAPVTAHGAAAIHVATGEAVLAAPLTMEAGSFSAESGTTVNFTAPANFSHDANLQVGEDVTLNIISNVRIRQPSISLDSIAGGENTIAVGPNAHLQIDGDHAGSFDDTVSLDTGSTLTLNGNFEFGPDALLTFGQATTLNINGNTRFRNNVDLAGINPFTTVNIAAGAELVANGRIASNLENRYEGRLLNRGALTVDGPTIAWLLGFNGVLELIDEGGEPSVFGDDIRNHGVISGTGLFAPNVENRSLGRIEPGNDSSTGRLRWDDSQLTMFSGSSIAFDIGGRAIGAEFDRIDARTANLGGDLEITLVDGFFPDVADSFPVLSATVLNGQFENVANGERLITTSGYGSFLVHYGSGSTFDPNQVVLSDFLSVANPGDYNNDGVVNATDYAVWRDHLGTPATLPNDLTPGTVDQSDYVTWKNNFGAMGGAKAAASPAAVPEPSTWALFLLGAVVLLGSRGKSRAIMLLLLCALVAAEQTASAQFSDIREWTNRNGGVYTFPGNWNPLDFPGVDEAAVFGIDNDYTVELPIGGTTGEVLISRGDVTFDLKPGSSSRTLTVSNNLIIGGEHEATMTILDGTVSAGNVVVRDGGRLKFERNFPNVSILNISGDLDIDGGRLSRSGSDELNLATGSEVTVRNGGDFRSTRYRLHQNSTVHVLSGGIFDHTEIQIAGSNSTGDGTLLIDGPGSYVESGFANTTHYWGVDGHAARVDVTSGATLLVDGELNLATEGDGSTADITIAGPGSQFLFPDVGAELIIGGVNGSASLTVTDGGFFQHIGGAGISKVQIRAGGEINVTDGGIFEARNIEMAGGQFNLDGGTLRFSSFDSSLLNRNGRIEPGRPIGGAFLAGNYTQQADATLAIDIGGILAGDFDGLGVNGNAILDGTLEIQILNDFVPVIGNEFTILQTGAGNVGGTFDTLNFPVVDGKTFDVVYNPKSIVLQVIETAVLAGDYNNDGVVNATDYAVWRDHLGTPATLPNDLTPGTVDQSDYLTWKNNFGAVAGAQAASPSAAVPEPSAWLLLLWGVGASFWFRVRRPAPKLATAMVVPILVAALVGLASRLAWAQGGAIHDWAPTSGGVFSDPFNWIPFGVPGPGDAAFFSHDATYTVSLPSDADPHDIAVNRGKVTFDLNSSGTPRTLSVPGSLTIGGDHDASLSIEDGSVNVEDIEIRPGGRLNLDDPFGLDSRLDVNSSLDLNRGHALIVGGNEMHLGEGATIALRNFSTLVLHQEFNIHDGKSVNVSQNSVIQVSELQIAGPGAPGDGTLTVDGSRSRAISANGVHQWGANNGAATVDVTGGADLEIRGDLNLAAAGTNSVVDISVSGSDSRFLFPKVEATLIVGHEDRGNAALNISDGAFFQHVGGAGGSRVEVQPTGVINVTSGATFEARRIEMQGGQFNLVGGTLRTDEFDGNLLNQGGRLEPGLSVGLSSVSGNYTQQAGSTLAVVIGGVLPGESDRFFVGGNVVVDGTLEVQVLDDFLPVIGNEFTVVESSAGNVGGVFDSFIFPTFNGLTFDIAYHPQTIVLQVVEAAGLAGDFNNDGFVNAADYAVWSDNLGTAATLPNDLTPGAVDQSDYATWKNNFGAVLNGTGSGTSRLTNLRAGASSPPVVPEPAAIDLFIALVGAATIIRASAARTTRPADHPRDPPRVRRGGPRFAFYRPA